MAYLRILKSAQWLVCSLVLTACSHDYHLMKVEEQLGSYGAAIRWSLFKRAMNFYAKPPSPMPDWQALKNIKVTGYQPLFRDEPGDGNVVLQTVEIRYVHLDDVVERTLTEEQHWRYDDDQSRWLLESGFPAFK